MTDDRPTHSIGRSIVTLATGTMAAQVVTLAMIPILSRIYAPASFGEYALFVSATTLLAVFGTARYELAIVMPRSPQEAAALARLGTKLLGAVSLFVTAVSAILLPFLDLSPTWAWLLLLTGPATFLLGYTTFVTQWLVRRGKYFQISRNRIAQSAISGISQITLGLLLSPTGLGLVVGLLIGQAAAAVVLTFADRAGARLYGTPSTRRWGYLLRKYWRLPAFVMPQTLIDSFRLNGVTLLLGNISVQALGQYSQAWRLVQVPAGMIGSAISQVYFPRLASVPAADLFGTVRGGVAKSLLFGALPFALIFWLSPTLFPVILGNQWTEAGRYAQALAPALFMNLAASSVSTIFVVLHKEQIGFAFALIYTCVSLSALFVFQDDLLLAIWIMSAFQTLALGGYIALALSLAGRVRPRPNE